MSIFQKLYKGKNKFKKRKNVFEHCYFNVTVTGNALSVMVD